MVKNWMCITSAENYEVALEKKVWGVRLRYKEKIEKIKKNDRIIFYIKGRLIGGSFKVMSEVYIIKRNIFYGGQYPYCIDLEPLIETQDFFLLTNNMINNLDFFTYKDKRWIFNIMGKSIIEISNNDYNYFKKIFKKHFHNQSIFNSSNNALTYISKDNSLEFTDARKIALS